MLFLHSFVFFFQGSFGPLPMGEQGEALHHYFKVTISTCPLGMDYTLGDPFTVEVGEFIEKMDILH
jgi:hypothetical protein